MFAEAVVDHRAPGEPDGMTLEPGSYFSSKGESTHAISSDTEECVIYVRTEGGFELLTST